MFNLIDRLESLGPKRAPAVLLGAVLLAALSGYCGYRVWLLGNTDYGWAVLMWGFCAWALGSLTMVFGMVGARLLRGNAFPSVEETFPSLTAEDFRAALYAEPRPICACSLCLIHLPSAFSTGGCPRCTSSVNWYTVESDEDAEMVISSMYD